jgi:hypothetical protein
VAVIVIFSDIMIFKSSVFVATGHIVRSNGHDCVELVRLVALNLFNSVLNVLSSLYIKGTICA